MLALHAGKCTDEELKARDEAFWRELEATVTLPALTDGGEDDSSSPLWRFQHFLTKQRIIALPLTGRTRVEGVSRLSLGPLKDMEEGRRQVRAVAYYPGLSHQPTHDYARFTWLHALHARADTIRSELDAYLLSADSIWGGNACQDFDHYGWSQISLNTFGLSHEEPLVHFPNTLQLLADLNVPYGPRDLCIVRQEAKSGLPRHSDQRNYMLTAHIVLKSPDTQAQQAPSERQGDGEGQGGGGSIAEEEVSRAGRQGGLKLNRAERRKQEKNAAKFTKSGTKTIKSATRIINKISDSGNQDSGNQEKQEEAQQVAPPPLLPH